MGLGRSFRRSFRRTFRRVFRPVERLYRTRVGRVISGIGTLGISEQVHAQNEAVKQARKEEAARQAQIDKAIADREAESAWSRDQAKAANAIISTQRQDIGNMGTDVNLDFESALQEDEEEDILKRMIKNK